MNKQIKHLYTSAVISSHSAFTENMLIPDAVAKKFAELIIEECSDVAYKVYWDNPETVRGIHLKEKIKEHFGVEE